MPRKTKVAKGIIGQIFNLCKKMNKNFKKIPIIIQLGILLCLIVVFFKRNPMEPFENKSTGAQITFFHMNGCGHCEKMKSEWKGFENKWNDPSIVINNKERSEAQDLCKKYNISGFPTVIFTIDGEIPKDSTNKEHVYNGDRTAVNFNEWANEMKENFLS